MIKPVALGLLSMLALAGPVLADAKQDACKKAMNDRIQVCTDECTRKALEAASNYVDKNNNVKFGCLKGCALGQVMQMRSCENASDPPQNPAPSGPRENNR